jgi:type 1 glutamine amidotransferase
MRTLVFCDDFYHPAAIPRAGLEALGDAGYEFNWLENAGDWSAQRMAGYALVVLVKANNISSTDKTEWMTGEIETAFLDYVRRGNGLLALHSGTAGYRQRPILRRLLGGVFEKHPPQCPVTVEPKQDHPLTAGSASFTLQDEHYFMEMDDPQVDLFLTTTSEHGTQPGGWTRTEGQGRVCVLTPGHNKEVWLHPSFQALLRNALHWCSQ